MKLFFATLLISIFSLHANAEVKAFAFECVGKTQGGSPVKVFLSGLEEDGIFTGDLTVLGKTSRGPLRADIAVEGKVVSSKKLRAYSLVTRLFNTQFQQATLSVTTNNRSRITLVNGQTSQATSAKLNCLETPHE